MKYKTLIFPALAILLCVVGFFWTQHNYEANPGHHPPLIRWVFEMPLIVGMLLGSLCSLVTMIILIVASRKHPANVLVKTPVFWLSLPGLAPGMLTLFWIMNLTWKIATGA